MCIRDRCILNLYDQVYQPMHGFKLDMCIIVYIKIYDQGYQFLNKADLHIRGGVGWVVFLFHISGWRWVGGGSNSMHYSVY